MANRSTRRTFLKQAAATGMLGPVIFTNRAYGQNASRKLRHALVGVAGMQGGSDMGSFASHADIEFVALCDVDKRHLAKGAQKAPHAKQYLDWREMLDKENKNIDSISVTIPDHMHAPITMTALRMGKHVYSQKPLCHDIYECHQIIQEAAARPDQVTQMGIQCHSINQYRLAVAMLQWGVIGKVKEVHSWSNKGWVGRKGSLERRPDRTDPVPDYLDWDLWLGTAPQRPYVNKLYHPCDWRRWIDFGTGTQGDMAAHIMDPVYSALELTSPSWVMSYQTPPFEETYSGNNKIVHRFPQTKYTTGEIDWYWYDAGCMPDESDWPLEHRRSKPDKHGRKHIHGQGSMFIGEKGCLHLPHVGSPEPLFPETELKEILTRFKQEVKLPPIPTHYHQFVDAALGKGKTTAPFSYAGPLTQTVIMGTVINRFPKEKLTFDGENCQFTNKPEANKFLRRTYRSGWEVDGLS